MKRLFILTTWFATTFITLGISLQTYAFLDKTTLQLRAGTEQKKLQQTKIQPSLAYASIPDIVTELRTAVGTKDARALAIERYLKSYASPMIGTGEFIVQKADVLGAKNEIDPTYLSYLTVAIAQNESNLGKRMPSSDCYNAWGYGIHSTGTLCFKNWEEGISRFMTGVAEDFINKRGLETPEQIMTRYTPTSPNGAWAKGVNQFLDELYHGNF